MADDVLAWADSLGGNDVTPKKKPQPDDLLDWADSLGSSAPASPSKYDSLFQKHAQANNLDPDLLRAMTQQESTFKPNAVSPKGAQGLMQLMPGTAKRFKVSNIYDPDQNIRGGAEYMKFLLDHYNGDVAKALAGYNAGEGAVDKYKGIPPFKETQDYVKKITGRYKGSGYAPAVNENSVWTDVNSLLGTDKQLSPIVPSPQPQEPVQTLQTPVGIDEPPPLVEPPPLIQAPPPPPLIQKPIVPPEGPNTIAAQIQSAQNPASPRAGVLTTDQAQNAAFGSLTGFQAFPVQGGTLWVNTAKAKKLKLKTPDDIQTFITKNPDGVTRLIGKVDNVADTSQGPALVTKDANGNELSSSIVTNPESAAAQAQVDQKQFPQAVTQEIKPAQAVVADRISTGNSTTVAGQTQNQPNNVSQPTQPADFQLKPGSPIPVDPYFNRAGAYGDAKVRDDEEAIPPTPEEAAQIQANQPIQFPHTFAKDQQITDSSVLGVAPIDPRLSPEENLRKNAKAVLNHYAPVSDEQIDKWINDSKAAGQPVTVGDPSATQMQINARMLAQIVGPDNAKRILADRLRTDAAQERIESPNLPLPAQVTQEQADELGPGPLSPENIRQGIDQSSGNELLDTLNIPGKFLARNMLAGVVGGGGHTANYLSGVLNTIEDLNPQRGDSMREATDPYGFQETNDALRAKGQPELSREQYLALRGLPPETKSFLRQGGDFFTGVGRASEDFQSKLGDKTLLGKGVQLLGNMTSDLPRMLVLPGGGIVNFAVDSYAQTRGQGGTVQQSLNAGFQGGALGALGEFVAPFVASAADTGVATLLNRASSPIFKKGVELATVGTGVYATSRLFGDSPEAAFDNAVLMSAMHLSGLLGKKAEGKGIEFRDTNGNGIRVEIKDGKVQTTDKPAEIKVVIPETAETGNAVPKTNETQTEVPSQPASVATPANVPNAEVPQPEKISEPVTGPGAQEQATATEQQPAQVEQAPAAKPNVAVAPEITPELHEAYKKAFELPLMNDTELAQKARADRQVKVTFETPSGKSITKVMTAGERQKQIENKGKVLQKILDCIHG